MIVRPNDQLRGGQRRDGSLQLSLIQTEIQKGLAIRDPSVRLPSDVKQEFRAVAWPAGLVYRLQKPRQIKAHVGVVCGTPAHRLGSLLTETKRVESRPAEAAVAPVDRAEACSCCPDPASGAAIRKTGCER